LSWNPWIRAKNTRKGWDAKGERHGSKETGKKSDEKGCCEEEQEEREEG
jgi:hypothetical protein